MKLRIGLGIGPWPFLYENKQSIITLTEECERLGIDSLWFSERVISQVLNFDPLHLISFISARSSNMKFGTSALVLPIRNPVVLAKELATIDYLSGGRLLLVVGLGSDESSDLQVSGIPRKERGSRTDEAITIMRLLWSGNPVTFSGQFYRFKDASLQPRPIQVQGPPIWIGGRSDPALRRVGRLGDGWLVSSVSLEEVGEGIHLIQKYASQYERKIPDDHYGVYLPFCFGDSPSAAEKIAKPNLVRRRTDLSPNEYCALGTPTDVRNRINDYLTAGATKFVMRPLCSPTLWHDQIRILAQEVVRPLQTPYSVSELQDRHGL